MAVAFDAFGNPTTSNGATASPRTWTHTPAGTPRGVLLFVMVENESGDSVATPTYGGVAMTEVAGSPFLATLGAELDNPIHVFFLGSSIPTGAQTISYAHTSSSWAAGCNARSITVTASADTAIEDTSTVDTSGANPTVSLTIANDSFIAGVLVSGHDAATSIAPASGFTETGGEGDVGAATWSVIRKDANASSNTTMDWVATTEDYAIFAVAIKEAAAVTGTLATTNAPDTSAGAGTTTVLGTLARTNAADTSAGAGTTTVLGTLARTNAADTSAAAGTTTVTGALATTNANDTLEAEGETEAGSVTGTLATTNAADTLAAEGEHDPGSVSGTLATTNANDTLAASGTTTVLGTLATTNADDTLAASGTVVGPPTVEPEPEEGQPGSRYNVSKATRDAWEREGERLRETRELEELLEREDEEIMVLV